jgi:pyruvate kinase
MNTDKVTTQIMATAGPTMEETEQIKKAIQAGATHFRINMGLRARDLHKYFRNIRLASEQAGKKVNVLLDMPTSRPRIGKMKPMDLSAGELVTLVDKTEVASDEKNTIPLGGLSSIVPSLEVGQRVLFRDGRVVFEIQDIDESAITVKCLRATTVLMPLGSSTFPDSDVSYRPLVPEDLSFFERFVESDLVPDFVSLSFASDKNQVQQLRSVVESYWPDNKINIIAKMETKNGLRNFDEILKEADGVMVARGDLLLHVPPYQLPKIQEHLVCRTNEEKKISIVATEMFEHFAVNGIVNRAELSDVALAVRQEANIVMLSRETGNSSYPLETIELIHQLVEEEKNPSVPFLNEERGKEKYDVFEASHRK